MVKNNAKPHLFIQPARPGIAFHESQLQLRHATRLCEGNHLTEHGRADAQAPVFLPKRNGDFCPVADPAAVVEGKLAVAGDFLPNAANDHHACIRGADTFEIGSLLFRRFRAFLRLTCGGAQIMSKINRK